MQRPEIQPGMRVRSLDGQRIGRVEETRGDGLVIRSRRLLARRYFAPYRDVRGAGGGEVLLGCRRDQLTEVPGKHRPLREVLGSPPEAEPPVGAAPYAVTEESPIAERSPSAPTGPGVLSSGRPQEERPRERSTPRRRGGRRT